MDSNPYKYSETKFVCVGYCFGPPYGCEEFAKPTVVTGAFTQPASSKISFQESPEYVPQPHDTPHVLIAVLEPQLFTARKSITRSMRDPETELCTFSKVSNYHCLLFSG